MINVAENPGKSKITHLLNGDYFIGNVKHLLSENTYGGFNYAAIGYIATLAAVAAIPTQHLEVSAAAFLVSNFCRIKAKSANQHAWQEFTAQQTAREQRIEFNEKWVYIENEGRIFLAYTSFFDPNYSLENHSYAFQVEEEKLHLSPDNILANMASHKQGKEQEQENLSKALQTLSETLESEDTITIVAGETQNKEVEEILTAVGFEKQENNLYIINLGGLKPQTRVITTEEFELPLSTKTVL